MDREKLFEPQIPAMPAFSQQRGHEEPSTTFKSVVRADAVELSEKPTPSDIYTVGYIYACTEPEYIGELPSLPLDNMAMNALLDFEDAQIAAHRALGAIGAFVTVYRFPQFVLHPELSMWIDGSDTVIAYSATDAVRVWEDHMGCPYEGDELNPAMCWVQTHKKLDDDFELWLDDSCTEKKKMTVREWIAEHGRGWFCTTEF